MIIAGNSNVDAFRQVGLRFSSRAEKIAVNWVGSIKVGQFYKGHPSGTKVRNLFNQESGWKLLSIGGHDIFELCMFASMGRVVDHFEAAFDSAVRSYTEVFRELSKPGKLAWLVFPQPVHLVSYKNLSAENISRISIRFNKRIEDLCAKQGVVVINPVPKMLGPDGEVLRGFLQRDGAHLNMKGVKKYIEEIELMTGESFYFRTDTVIFESASEIESFCSLFGGELHIPTNVAASPENVRNIIGEFVSKNLKDRGMDTEVAGETPLLSTGLVEKDFLNIIRDYASELMGMSIPQDAELNNLETIDEIISQLIMRRQNAASSIDMELLSQQDFFISLNGDYENSAKRESILQADERISNMDDELFRKMHEIAPLDSREVCLTYGIVSFWFSLNYARRGNYDEALRLIAQSMSEKMAFPFGSSRTELYRGQWEKRIEEKFSVWQHIKFRIFHKMIIPIWQNTIIKLFNRLLFPVLRRVFRAFNKL